MAKLDLLIKAWDEGHREFAIATEGLSDDDLWKRPHPKLLSVGELAGHLAYWQAQKATGHLPAGSPKKIEGILVDPVFSYYTTEVSHPVELKIGVAEMLKELMRVHDEAKNVVLELDPNASDPIPGESRATWGFYLEYMSFHVAYHTGQAYSVRHLLGHETTDN
jgi:hypothetical protein